MLFQNLYARYKVYIKYQFLSQVSASDFITNLGQNTIFDDTNIIKSRGELSTKLPRGEL